MDIKNIIIKGREDLGYSQKQLAEKSGTTQQLIARYESGQTEPKFSTGIAILNALGYDLSKLGTTKDKTMQENADHLQKYLAGLFNVRYTQIDLDSGERKGAISLEAVSSFNINNIQFQKDDSIILLENNVNDLMASINELSLEMQKSIYSKACLVGTKNYLKDLLLSEFSVSQNLKNKHSLPSVPDTELRAILTGTQEIAYQELINSLYNDTLSFDDIITGFPPQKETNTESKPVK